MPKYNIQSSSSGFTIVELVVATLMVGLIVAGLSIFVVLYLKTYSFSFEENQTIGLAQYAMTTLVKEVREARNADNGSWPLVQTDDQTFVFYSDVTNDGRSDKVRYFLDGTDLKKGVIEPTQVPVTYPPVNETIKTIASHIDNAGQPLFTYYNADWPGDQINNPLPPDQRLLNTRYIKIYLRINVRPDQEAQPIELSSGVQIRSLKDNL